MTPQQQFNHWKHEAEIIIEELKSNHSAQFLNIQDVQKRLDNVTQLHENWVEELNAKDRQLQELEAKYNELVQKFAEVANQSRLS